MQSLFYSTSAAAFGAYPLGRAEARPDDNLTAVATSREEGRALTKNGQLFAVITNGVFRLFRRTAARETLLTKDWRPKRIPKARKAIAAAALIATAAALGQTTIPLRSIVGTGYTGSVDIAPTVSAAFSGLGAHNLTSGTTKLTVTDDEGIDLKNGSQCTLASGLQWEFTSATRFMRAYSQDGVDNAQVATGATDDRLANLHLIGGTFDVWGGVATTSLEGHHLKFYANESYTEGLRFLNHYKGAAFFARGDNVTFERPYCDTPDLGGPDADNDTAAAGFRISEGFNFWIRNFFVRAPNDVAMLVIGMQNGGDEVIRQCGYINGKCYSLRAKCITVGASQNSETVTAFTGGIYDCLYENITGTSGRYAYRVVADGSDRKWVIDGVTLKNISITLDQTGNEGVDAQQIKGLQVPSDLWFGSIGRIRLDNVSVTSTAVRTAGVFDCPGAVIDIFGWKSNADRIACRVMKPCTINWYGVPVFNGPDASPDEGADADANDRSPFKTEEECDGIYFDPASIIDSPGLWNPTTGNRFYSGGMPAAEINFFAEPVCNNVATPTVDAVQKFLAGMRIKGGIVRLHRGLTANAAADADPGTKAIRVTGNGKVIYPEGGLRGTVTTLEVDGDGAKELLLAPMAMDTTGTYPVFSKLVAAVGSAAAPTIVFDDDLTTGIYQAATGRIGFSVSGALVGHFRSDRFDLSVSAYHPNGGAGAPSITFGNDTDTGIYRVGGNQLGISAGGTLRVTVSDAAVTFALPTINAPVATSALPAGSAGMEAWVNDATSAVYGAALAGGGANVTRVHHNGTGWLVG